MQTARDHFGARGRGLPWHTLCFLLFCWVIKKLAFVSQKFTFFSLRLKALPQSRLELDPPYRRRSFPASTGAAYRQRASGLPRTTPPLALSYIAVVSVYARPVDPKLADQCDQKSPWERWRLRLLLVGWLFLRAQVICLTNITSTKLKSPNPRQVFQTR